MYTSLRAARRRAFISYYLTSTLALIALGFIIKDFTLFAINAVLAVVWRRTIAKWFVSTTDCYHCGMGIDLDQTIWQCGCGFRRACRAGAHVFDTCPQCSSSADVFPCTGCQVSLLI